MGVRGIRGATTVAKDTPQEIWQATKELVEEIIKRNQIFAEQVASVWITVTNDLTSAFPAKAVRSVEGWDLVPLMCSTEIPVPGSLENCIRVMLIVNTDLNQDEVKHVFQREAAKLRPDLVNHPLTKN